MTPETVLALINHEPRKVGEIGLLLVTAQPAEGQPIGAFLAQQGISLSGLQQVVDGLVAQGFVRELRGRDLWDERWPGLGPNAKGRYFVRRS